MVARMQTRSVEALRVTAQWQSAIPVVVEVMGVRAIVAW